MGRWLLWNQGPKVAGQELTLRGWDPGLGTRPAVRRPAAMGQAEGQDQAQTHGDAQDLWDHQWGQEWAPGPEARGGSCSPATSRPGRDD